jgi:hypothetical protein
MLQNMMSMMMQGQMPMAQMPMAQMPMKGPQQVPMQASSQIV